MKEEGLEIVRKLFSYFMITYFLLLIFEEIKAGSVSSFFNLNYFLIFLVIAGIVVLLIGDFKDTKIVAKKKNYFLSIGAGLISIIIIVIGVRFLNSFAYYISIFSGIVIAIIVLVVLREK